MKILIIEDNDSKFGDLNYQISKFLKNRDIEVEIKREISVNSGSRTLIEESFDLLILDMQMPQMDDSFDIEKDGGIQVLDNIEFYEVKAPYIIVASANENIADMVESYKVDSIWYEPGEFEEELKVLLNNFLEKDNV